MKWLPFGILATLGIVCQTTLLRHIAIGSIWPDFMFILVVYYALWGPWPDAAIAAWILGLLVDLQSAPPTRVGLHALCFGLAALGIMRLRQSLFRDHPMTHLVVTLVFAFLVQVMVRSYFGWLRPDAFTLGEILSTAALTALYTAIWAPNLLWPLIHFGRWTGLRPSGRPAY